MKIDALGLDPWQKRKRKSQSGVPFIALLDSSTRQLAAEAAQGLGLPSQAAEIRAVLDEMNAWGREHGWPMHNAYPKYARIRELGRLAGMRDGCCFAE